MVLTENDEEEKRMAETKEMAVTEMTPSKEFLRGLGLRKKDLKERHLGRAMVKLVEWKR